MSAEECFCLRVPLFFLFAQVSLWTQSRVVEAGACIGLMVAVTAGYNQQLLKCKKCFSHILTYHCWKGKCVANNINEH